MSAPPAGDDTPPLPELHQSEVGADTVEDLFRDVALEADLLDVIVKGAAEAHADEGPVDLGRAKELLLSGAIRGVQLRYRHQGEEWWDTILALGGRYRVVRMRQEPVPRSG
jgi:hypothetical protein